MFGSNMERCLFDGLGEVLIYFICIYNTVIMVGMTGCIKEVEEENTIAKPLVPPSWTDSCTETLRVTKNTQRTYSRDMGELQNNARRIQWSVLPAI